jgi:hypothetical protein
MVFPVVGGNESKGYEISNSLRFNDDDSASLSFTPSGNPTDADKFTISCWIKLGNIGVNNAKIYDTGGSDDNNRFALQFQGTNSTLMTSNNSGVSIITSQVLRDPSAWYHVVAAIDSQNSTTNNKHIIYVNGVQADIGTNNLGSTSQVGAMTNGVAQYIGRNGGADNSHFDGYMTEFHFVDGQQLAPTSFGEFDDNGVWIPKKYTGTYGNNGFFMEFQQTGTSANSSGIGADTSGNDNHFTPTNLAATDITTDTPTNSFATWNPLDLDLSVTPTLSEGNTQLAQPASGYSSNCNFGVSQGKWYFEWKPTDRDNILLSIVPQNLYPAGNNLFTADKTIGIYAGNPNLYQNGSNQGSLGGGLSNDDIVMYAMDLDNNLLYIGKNGQWNDGLGGGFDQSDFGNANGFSFNREADAFYVVSTVNGSGSSNYTVQMNFGNPPYAVSSGNTDGKYGNFEYAPPSGYYALCTKRLAEFG